MGYIVDPGVTPLVPIVEDTSPDGILLAKLDAAHAAVYLHADFSTLVPQPHKVRFLREGQPVRSGYDRRSPAGRARAYDFLAPLNKASTWQAVALSSTGAVLATSEGVSIEVPEPTRRQGDVWIKPLADPGMMMLVDQLGQMELAVDGRGTYEALSEQSELVGSWAPGTYSPRTLTIRTNTAAERTQLWQLLKLGCLFLQYRSALLIEDFYAWPGRVSELPQVKHTDERRVFTIELQPTAAPDHFGAPLVIPGRSWAKIAQMYTWGSLDASIASWEEVTDPV